MTCDDVNQKELRNRLRNFIKEEGVIQKFISTKTCIDASLLSRFKNAQIDLESVDAHLLDLYLKSKSY